MYHVTKRIDFCYGHRLLDYDGICKHPHGHNAVVEIDVRTDRLDRRNMVADFGDIKRLVKGWTDRELDHKMILRRDDPLVRPLQELGEPIPLSRGSGDAQQKTHPRWFTEMGPKNPANETCASGPTPQEWRHHQRWSVCPSACGHFASQYPCGTTERQP